MNGKWLTADDIVSEITSAPDGATARAVLRRQPRELLEAVADLLYVDSWGLGTRKLIGQIITEARA